MNTLELAKIQAEKCRIQSQEYAKMANDSSNRFLKHSCLNFANQWQSRADWWNNIANGNKPNFSTLS